MRVSLLAALCLAAGLVGPIALPHAAVALDHEADPGQDAGAVSRLQRSEDVLTDMMGRLDQASLDCQRCTWKSARPATPGEVLQLEVRGSSLTPFRRFLADLGTRWNWRLLSLSTRPGLSDAGEPQVQIAADLALAAGQGQESPETIALFRTLESLPAFAMAGPAPTSPHLFGCTMEEGRGPDFQVIAPALDQLLSVPAGAAFPGRSRSLSRTVFQGQDLFTLEFTDRPEGLPVPDLVGVFKTLAGAAGLREIVLPRNPAGADVIQVSLDVEPGRWEPVGEILATGFGYDLLKAEARGEPSAGAPPEAWAVSLLLRKGSGRGFPASELGAILAAAWPATLRSGLQLAWLPGTLRLLAPVGGEPDVTLLKGVADGLGLSYLGPQTRESRERNVLVVAFGRQQAPPAAAAGTPPGPAQVGEVFDTTVTPDGPRISVRLAFTEIPALLANLGKEGKCVGRISLECRAPDLPVISYLLTEGQPVAAARILRRATILAKIALPWNRPLDEVGRGLLLDGFTIGPDEEFELRGATLKSRLIFAELFPKLQVIPGVHTPFFREGKYTDHPAGRLMRFVVTARWSEADKDR